MNNTRYLVMYYGRDGILTPAVATLSPVEARKLGNHMAVTLVFDLGLVEELMREEVSGEDLLEELTPPVKQG